LRDDAGEEVQAHGGVAIAEAPTLPERGEDVGALVVDQWCEVDVSASLGHLYG